VTPVVLVAAVLLQAAPAPAATPSPDPVASARALLAQGRAPAAIEALRGPAAGDVRAAELLGVAYYHAGDAPRAIQQLTSVLPRLAADSLERREAVQVLGLAEYLAGRIADSIPHLEETRAALPDNPELAYVLGMAYIQTRQPARARDTWARAFKVAPDSAAAHLVTAQMMVRAELDEMAEAELKAALGKDPRLPRVHFLLGQGALHRGRVEEAIALLGQELEISPGDGMAFFLLGDAYVRAGRFDEALVSLQRSLWVNPYFSGPYVLMGRAYLRKKDLAAAENALRRAAAIDPNNTAAHYLLAQALQQAGRADEAKREFEAAERLQGPVER
jgi:cytochrome c-type biogenesis protein CcmH/NrfG